MNNQIGLGVLINSLDVSTETVEALRDAIGATIQNAWIGDNRLQIQFTDGRKLIVYDDGQSCCETRYMSTDDELSSLSGEVFVGLEKKSAPNISDEYGEHEVEFLDIITNRSRAQIANHNEHNGYYGGFWIAARWA